MTDPIICIVAYATSIPSVRTDHRGQLIGLLVDHTMRSCDHTPACDDRATTPMKPIRLAVRGRLYGNLVGEATVGGCRTANNLRFQCH